MLSKINSMYSYRLIAIVTMWVVISGCSGSGGSIPTEPAIDTIDQLQQVMDMGEIPGQDGGYHSLLGLWEVIIDREESSVEMVPLRSVLYHANLVKVINYMDAASVTLDSFASNPAQGIYALDFTFEHPYPTSTYLYGFDVKGIIITPGTLEIGGVTIADLDEWRLLNADGYTRWWNPTEFPGSGWFGYVSGEHGSPHTELLTATVNPYKYYCTYLDNYQPVSDIIGLPLDDGLGRGITLVGSTSTRRFMVKLPEAPGSPAVFNYALDVCWDVPDPFPPVDVPDDFPIKANQAEAYNVGVEAKVNTLFYNPDDSSGGQLVITADVSDWQGQLNGNIAEEVAMVRVYAPELFSDGQIMDLVSDDGSKAKYWANLTGLAIPIYSGDYLVMVRVQSDDGTLYSTGPQTGPDQPINAYQVITVNVPEIGCEPDDNNHFDQAEPIDWGDSVQASLCRHEGQLIDYSDYYIFDNGSENWEQGTINLYTISENTHLSVFDLDYNHLEMVTVEGGVASINTLGVGGIGSYYIRILTHNETEIVQYELELVQSVIPDPPVFIQQISGTAYPRNKNVVTYQVQVKSDLPLTYQWEVKHPEGISEVDLGEGNGDGSVDVVFDWMGIEEGEWHIKCRVDDGWNSPVNSVVYPVWVNGLIFHADLNDITSGDNYNWFAVNEGGLDTWTIEPVSDDILSGTGRKFGPANVDVNYSSASILVTPPIALPETMVKGLVVFTHSFDFGEIERGSDNTFWFGYSGGNVKLSIAPGYPVQSIEPAEIIAGRPYWSKVISQDAENMLEGQDLISGINTDLVTSVVEIPISYAGDPIYVGFAACASKYVGFFKSRGWLIDDVKIYIIDDSPNESPSVGDMEGAILTPAFSAINNLEISAEDPDGDRVYYQWYLWDFRPPGGRVETQYYDSSSSGTEFKVQDIVEYSEGYLWNYSNRYMIMAKITDGFNPPTFRADWVVGGGLLFHADWEWSQTDFDNRNWISAFDEDSQDKWFTEWGNHYGLPGDNHGPYFTGGSGDWVYHQGTQSVLISPPIFIPPGFTNVQLGFVHQYEFDDYGLTGFPQDGGNVHILDADDYMSDFSWSNLPLDLHDSFHDYDALLVSNCSLYGMPAFCDDDHPDSVYLSVHNLDSYWITNLNGLRIAFAAATGTLSIAKAGWQIDEIYLMGN